jgi:predicted peptidase
VPDLKGIPIWCFHNDLDMLVGCGGSREMCKRINEAGGNAKLTTYGGLAGDLNHNVWDRAYKEPDLVPWMLRQRRQR